MADAFDTPAAEQGQGESSQHAGHGFRGGGEMGDVVLAEGGRGAEFEVLGLIDEVQSLATFLNEFDRCGSLGFE